MNRKIKLESCIEYTYKGEEFVINEFVCSVAGIMFDVEKKTGEHVDFFTPESLCNNARDLISQKYPEYLI